MTTPKNCSVFIPARLMVWLGLSLTAFSVSAATIVWNGASGTDTNWSNGNNWINAIAPGGGDDVKFYDTGANGTAGAPDNLVDSSFGGFIGSLQYGNTNGFHTTFIAAGQTLNVTNNGGLTAGTLTANGNAQVVTATIMGTNGTLNVSNTAANVLVVQGLAANGSGTQRATLDLSGLGAFNANVSRISVGDITAGNANNAQNATGTLKLAQTNSITTLFAGTAITNGTTATPTNAINIGLDNGNAGGVNFFYLGQMNTFSIDSIGVGLDKATSSMLFNPGWINPSATFYGTNGSNSRVRFWTIGDMASSGSSSGIANGTNDFTGGTVNALVDTMSLGRDRQGGNTGATITRGTLIFGAGTINVNNIFIGNQYFTATGNSNPMNGVVNVNGTAVLQVNTNLVLGNTTVNSTAAQNTFGVLSVTNGTILANNIKVGTFSTSVNNAINLNGATLIITNSLATNATAGLAQLNIGNSTLGLNVPANAALVGLVKTLTAFGSTNLIQLAPVPVFNSYPQIIPLIQYTTLNGTFNFGLTNIPASAPNAYLTNITTTPSSMALVLPSDPRPNTLVLSPGSFTGPPGSTITLTVTIGASTATNGLSYQWYNGTTPLTDGTQVDGSTNYGTGTTSLIISNAQSGESGNYTVVVTNLYGSQTSGSAGVSISAGDSAPAITGIVPTNAIVIQGNSTSFTVSATAAPVPVYYWFDNNANLIPSATTATLTLNNVQPSQAGTYSVVVSNYLGTATTNVTVSVIVPPNINTQPTNVTVTVGSSAIFSVGAGGVPTPTYQWLKNNVAISSSVNSTATNATFIIASVAASDTANYSVAIVNAAGSTNSVIVALTVNSTNLSATALNPANGATGICYDTPLYITFSQTPVLNTLGKIRIYNVTNSTTPVDTLDMSLNTTLNNPYAVNIQARSIGGTNSTSGDSFNSFPVLITGTTAAIYPHGFMLTSNQTYYVTIDDGVFTDATGAYFAGITATNAWQFTTKTSGPANPTNLVVAADGSGDFLTVQGAVDSVLGGNTTPTLINIRNGDYTGIVDVKLKNNLDFRGQTRTGAFISYPNNNNVNPSGAPYRAMFVLNGNNCVLENLTLTNTTPHGGSQAEAIDVVGTRAIFYNMELDSYQDTFLVNSEGNLVYFQDSLIQGDTDFNWGYGTAFYTNCELRMLTAGGHVTQPRAPLGSNGFAFVNCQITPGSSSVTAGDLGRSISTPTTPSEVIFSQCLMGSFITGYNADAGTNFWDYADSNLTATASVTLANSTHLTSSSPIVALALSATNWLYGWQPQVAPNILTNPANLSVNGGSSATFTVVATGIGAPTYQWLKNGNPLTGQTNESLTIANAGEGDVATYSVIVSNSVGVVTSSGATLSVAGNAVVFTTPVPNTNFTINVGVNLSVACTATDSATSATLTYTLLSGPASAAVNSGSGNLTWRPNVSQAGSTNSVQVVATDNGTPNTSATNVFNIIVNPLTAPAAGSPVYAGGQFSLSLTGQIGPDYELQSTTNLAGGNWINVVTTNSPATMPVTLTDPNAGSQPVQFYRIVTGPPLP